MINAPTLWKEGYTGDGVVVAILDTGCDYDHDDLKENIIYGCNFTSDYNSNTKNFYDNNGHGTHIAGIIGAKNNIGVAPSSKLLILKTLNKYGKGNYKDLINAIKFCINWTGPNKERVRVISISAGLEYNSIQLHNIIRKAIKNNIVIVCSAGNMGDGKLSTIERQYPAIYNEVIQVGAIDNNYKVADFSNTNPEVDIVAPGIKITSTFLNNTYASFSGTSMAAPYVSGAIALLICKYEEYRKEKLIYSQILELLYKHTKLIVHDNVKYKVLDFNA